ncbi:MAG: thioredoxin domain-containing protein [Mailhella sp.]|nr:thioredoxin domain-containing protein [Mailhella sp.]
MSFISHIYLVLALIGGCLFCAPAAHAASDREVAAQLEALLKERPELVLDVLRAHGTELLDIVQKAADTRRISTLKKQWEEDMQRPKKVKLAGRPEGGSADAPVTVVAYSDFLCSYCHKAAFTVGNLMKRYSGKIRFIFKQVPKSEAGRLVGQWFLSAYKLDKAKGWKMYALAFDRQKEVEAAPDKTMRAIAKEVGLDLGKLEMVMKAQAKQFGDMMDADIEEADALGFVGTPYFLVNDLVVRGALSLEDFSTAVDMALAKKAGK